MAAHPQLVDPETRAKLRAGEPQERRDALDALRLLQQHDLPRHALRALEASAGLLERYVRDDERAGV